MSTPSDSNWIQIAKFKKNSQLADVEKFLTANNIRYQWREEPEFQCLLVGSEVEAQVVAEFLNRAWPISVLALLRADSSKDFKQLFKLVPLTLSIIFICSLLLLLDLLDLKGLSPLLNFMPLEDISQSHEWWRLFTPAIMHAGIFHLVFNMLWTWELGARIEYSLGTFNSFLIVVISAVFSNLLQYFVSGSIHFLGYSGVVYAYLGFLWIYGKGKDVKILRLPDRIFYFMFIWLALGVVGLIDWILPGNIKVANGAHVGGWVMGMLLARIFLRFDGEPGDAKRSNP